MKDLEYTKPSAIVTHAHYNEGDDHTDVSAMVSMRLRGDLRERHQQIRMMAAHALLTDIADRARREQESRTLLERVKDTLLENEEDRGVSRPALDFYNTRTRGKFYTDDWVIETAGKKNFAVARRNGNKVYRIVSKSFAEAWS